MERPTSLESYLFDNLPVGVAILNPDLQYRYINAAYAATQGMSPAQLLDRALDTGSPDWVALVQRMITQARETHRAAEEFDIPLIYPRQPSLRRIWDVTVLPMYRDRELDGFVLYLVDVTSRRQAEELSDSESRLRGVLGVAADAILVIDEHGRILQANPAASRIFGYSNEEFVGLPITTIMPSPYHEEHDDYLRRYLHTGLPHIIGTIREVEGRRKGGATFPMELSVAESRTGAQRRVFVGIIRDITERKRVEDELRKLSRAVEQSPDVVIITDLEGRIEYVNPKFTAVTGYTAADVYGRNPNILKSGETPHEEYDRLWATIRAGEDWHGEFHNRKKNGELYWESATITPIRDATGQTTHFLAMKEDITERKRLQAELESARARLEAILDTVPLPLLVIGPSAQIIMSNDAAREFYGHYLSEGHLLEMTRLHPDTRQPWPSEEWPLVRALREGHPINNVEQLVVFPDGREVPILVHAAPVVVDGQTIASVGVVQDLTELRAADRAKDAFLALISHELKSPLATIISWGDLALDDPTVRDDALTIILRNAQAQRRIIDDLLDVSRVIYGKMTLELELVDAWEVAKDTTEGLQGMIDEKHLHLVLQPPGKPLPVRADPVRLGQIFSNLLTNAIKFTPADGTITVAGTQDGDLARLSVTDTGRGIPPDRLPLIFRRFQQIGRERISGGLGLGLALVKGLVELHHGRVEASSAGANQGSTFTVWLPLWQEGGDRPVQ